MKPCGEEEEEEGAAGGGGDPWKECLEVAVQLALRAGQVRAAPRSPPQPRGAAARLRARRDGGGQRGGLAPRLEHPARRRLGRCVLGVEITK